MKDMPFVSILIVNYNGKHLLDECLRSVFDIDYPENKYEVFVVDNNSTDNSIAFIESAYPQVHIVPLHSNVGFAGGNNEGFQYAQGESIVLLNSDVRVDRGWLRSLVNAAKDPKVGVVNSKLYFSMPFLELELNSSTITRAEIEGNTDFSPLGVLLEDVVCSTPRLTEYVWYGSGFYDKKGKEISLRWSKGSSRILVPFDQEKQVNEYKITLHGYPVDDRLEEHFSFTLGKETIATDILAPRQVRQYKIKITKDQAEKNYVWLVQNAGNVVLKDGYCKDRGSVVTRNKKETREFYEKDSSYYHQEASLLACCGASVLIKRKVIEEVGLFDERYFMYYEDIDFSLRAWLAGWEIRYAPDSIGYHKHKATTNVANNTFMLYHIEKNHFFLLLTFFPFKIILIEGLLFMLRFFATYVKLVMYQFRDNLPRYELWMLKFRARRQVLQDIVWNIFPLLRKRRSLTIRREDAWGSMSKYMY